MTFLNTLIEWEGAVVNARPRYWAAHQAALASVRHQGPTEEEFWRLVRTGASDGMLVPHAKTPVVAEYKLFRDQRIERTELLALDELQPTVRENLPILKGMGTCHMVSLCQNREGINAALNRLDVWIHFDQKRSLPLDSDRRVEVIKELMTTSSRNMAIAGTIPFAFAANEAGCRVIGMKTGMAYPKQFRQVGVDVFFDTLDQLTDALARHDPELQRIGL